MRHLLPLCLILPALLSACAAPDGDSDRPFPGLFPTRESEDPPAPPPLPASVQAALPPGVPSSLVLLAPDGCYIYSVERTDPPSGYPVRDAAGNRICEGGPEPVTVAAASPIRPPAPVTTEPLDAETASMATPLRGVGEEPEAEPADAVVEPGDITPPTPIAPLNG